MAISMPDEPREPLAWSKKYEVFSLSRLYLSSLGFSTEAINSLTDADMQRIADTYNNRTFIGFEEDIKFLVACEITEKQADVMNREFPVSVVTREDLLAANVPQDVVEKISDEDMQRIAHDMSDQHTEFGGYWEELEAAVNKVLCLEAEEEDHGTEPMRQDCNTCNSI